MDFNKIPFPKSGTCTEAQVKDFLKEFGIPTPEYSVVAEEEELDSLNLRFPAVLKVCSAAILHKTEAGGVKLGLRNGEELRREFRLMKGRFPGEKFLVEGMEKEGLELIVGLIHDPTFGLNLMVGLGGIFAEVFKDVSFRKVPLDRTEADRMLGELKGHKALEGFRGQKIDREKVIDLIVRVSELAVNHGGRIGQLDLNPVIVREDSLCVVDAKLILRVPEADRPPSPSQSLPQEALRRAFYPQNVAVIGASANPEKEGHLLIKNILGGGYKGKVIPVNPSSREICGLEAVKSVGDIPGPIDLAVICLAAGSIPGIVEECGRKGVRSAVVVSSGFGELDEAGRRISEEIRSLLARSGLRMIGPNCQGLVNVGHRFFASFGVETLLPKIKPGGIGFFSQSGSVTSDFVQRAGDEGLGLAAWVNLGNKINVDESDIISLFDSDPQIKVISGYLEDIKDGEKFVGVIQKLNKPLVILKSGRTEMGQKSAGSHTAALAGNDRVIDGIFRQFRVYRAETTDDLFDLTKALSLIPPPRGRRLLIVESSGGIGTLASDVAGRAGLELPDLDEEGREKLRAILPPFLKPQNPIDLGTQWGRQFCRVAEARVLDGYDALLLIFADPVLDAAAAVRSFWENTDKPIVVSFSGGGKVQEEEAHKIRDLGIPVYPNVERALRFFGCAVGV